MDKKYITVSELKDYLGVARQTAYVLANAEGFPSFRVGKKILINVEKLNEWIANGGNPEIRTKNYG